MTRVTAVDLWVCDICDEVALTAHAIELSCGHKPVEARFVRVSDQYVEHAPAKPELVAAVREWLKDAPEFATDFDRFTAMCTAFKDDNPMDIVTAISQAREMTE